MEMNSQTIIKPMPLVKTAATPNHSWFVRVMSYLSLCTAVLSMAAVGPMFLYMEHLFIPPILAAVWRQQFVCVFLILPTVIEIRSHWKTQKYKYSAVAPSDDIELETVAATPSAENTPVSAEEQNNNGGYAVSSPFTLKFFAYYIFAPSFTWSASLAIWVIALQYTSTARASLFCSVYPLLLVGYYCYKGEKISWGEICGVLVAIAGIVCTELTGLLSPNTAEQSIDSASQLKGDILCLLVSVILAVDVVFRAEARKRVPLFTYTFCTSLVCLVLLSIVTILYERTADELVGWVFHDWDMILFLIFFGFLVGCIGALGYNYSVAYIHPVIFSVIQLLDPGITGVISWIAKIEAFPSISTLLGVAIVTAGISVVVINENKRKNESNLAHTNLSKTDS
jgi:drug/metabolite transporter (DMT)-like permease